MLEVERLTVAYDTNVAVQDLSLRAYDGEVLCVIGPSGCGKSTLLRAVAGLVPLQAGSVRLDGEVVDAFRPDQRGVGLMFQDNALFPHRTVGENVAFGPRMRGLDRLRIEERVTEALELVDLQGTASRRVTELSGGEQQRVALARAIAPRPRLLMLDEPLGSLDRALRERLLADLPTVFSRVGTTVVYVTHDQDEALALADRIAVMRAGRLEQVGPPEELWSAPRSEFVARFLGLEHVLEVEVSDGRATTSLGEIPVGTEAHGPATLVLLPDALRLSGPHDPLRDSEIAVHGTVVDVRFSGDHTRLRVGVAETITLSVPVWRGPVPSLGERIVVAVDPGAVHVIERPRRCGASGPS